MLLCSSTSHCFAGKACDVAGCCRHSVVCFWRSLLRAVLERSRQRLRSAQQNTLVVPRYRLTTYGRRAFSVAGSTPWNSLPVAFRDPTIRDACFRWHLKTVLFAQQRRHHSARARFVYDYALYKFTFIIIIIICQHIDHTCYPSQRYRVTAAPPVCSTEHTCGPTLQTDHIRPSSIFCCGFHSVEQSSCHIQRPDNQRCLLPTAFKDSSVCTTASAP